MKKIFFAFLSIFLAGVGNPFAFAIEQKVTIVEPANHARVTSPVNICLEVEGLIVEKADDKVIGGRGHHHILFNSLPVDLTKPIGKDEIHLGDGSSCRSFDLNPGKHIVIALFAYGNHVPYNPPISDKIIITVKNPK